MIKNFKPKVLEVPARMPYWVCYATHSPRDWVVLSRHKTEHAAFKAADKLAKGPRTHSLVVRTVRFKFAPTVLKRSDVRPKVWAKTQKHDPSRPGIWERVTKVEGTDAVKVGDEFTHRQLWDLHVKGKIFWVEGEQALREEEAVNRAEAWANRY